jgi:putative DNA primase/helicase
MLRLVGAVLGMSNTEGSMGQPRRVIDLNAYARQDEPQQQARPASVAEALDAFRDALAAAGLGRPEIEPDGRLHRFDLPDEARGKRSGWAVFYPDNIPAGAYGSWKEDLSETWCLKANYELSTVEVEAVRERFRQARAARDAERERLAKECSVIAADKWAKARDEDGSHPYLRKKQVGAFGVKSLGKELLIPMWDASGSLRSLQRIFPDGVRRFLTGTTKPGAFGWIEGDKGVVYIAEGYATGASIHMATGHAVAIGFDAGNLESTAKTVREVFPQAQIIVAADNDRWATKGDGSPWNVGVEKGQAAAHAIGVKAIVPDFKDLSSHPTDFNDLHALEGLDEVRRQLRPTNFEIITFSDIMGMHFDEKPVAEGLVDETENLLVIGPSNIGKSLFTVNMAIFLAMPKPQTAGVDLNGPPKLFGLFPVPRQRRVLFLQSENTAKATKKRLAMIMKDRPEIAKALPNIVAPVLGSNDCRVHGPINREFFDQAQSIIRRSGADVVVLDPLISFHDCDENDNVAMRAALDRFNDLATLTGASFIIVHHTGKDAAKGGRGASAIRDWYDNALILDQAHSGQGRFVLRVNHDKSRNYKIQAPFYLERTENLDYVPVEDPEVFLVTQAVRDAGGIIQTEMALIEAMEALTSSDMSRAHWQRVIKRAVRQGLIEKEGSGKNQTFLEKMNRQNGADFATD